MARPQQPELARSAKTDLDPDHVETGLQGQKTPATGGETGPVPAENQPGHHPPEEQDKPDLDAFAARAGTDPKAPADKRGRKVQTASRPPARPKKSPTREAAAQISAPQPEPERQPEPRLVGLMLFPLRETVKRLGQLDRTLTERLARRSTGDRGPTGR